VLRVVARGAGYPGVLKNIIKLVNLHFHRVTKIGKGGSILAAKIGPGGPVLVADQFFCYRPATYQCSDYKRRL